MGKAMSSKLSNQNFLSLLQVTKNDIAKINQLKTLTQLNKSIAIEAIKSSCVDNFFGLLEEFKDSMSSKSLVYDSFLNIFINDKQLGPLIKINLNKKTYIPIDQTKRTIINYLINNNAVIDDKTNEPKRLLSLKNITKAIGKKKEYISSILGKMKNEDEIIDNYPRHGWYYIGK